MTIDRTEIIKQGLPYFDNNGWIRNTHHFKENSNKFLEKGFYCPYPKRTKAYKDFWEREADRIINGIQLGEVYISGYYYFFLNYHKMTIVDQETGNEYEGFPDFWFIHWQFFRVLDYVEKNHYHISAIKPRRCGYSEIASAMGTRDYCAPFKDKNGHTIFKNDWYFAADNQYLSDDGVFSKTSSNIDFVNTETAFKRGNLVTTSMIRTAGIRYNDNTKKRTGGHVQAVIVDKPDKVRGKKGFKLFFEESGSFPELLKALNVARPLVEPGGYTIGQIIAWGTSNSKSEHLEGLKEIVLEPHTQNMVKFRNIWEFRGKAVSREDLKNLPKDPLEYIIPREDPDYYKNGTGIGWFVPVYMSMFKFFDKDGNPDMEATYDYVQKERRARMSGSNEDSALEWIGDHPLTPTEALKKAATNYFNIPALSKQIIDIETGLIEPNIERGNLFWTEDPKKGVGVEFIKDPTGEIKIYEHPSWVKKTRVGDSIRYQSFQNDKDRVVGLYVAGIDSIDQGLRDSNTKYNLSNLAGVVKKRIPSNNALTDSGNLYVALYNNRSDDVRQDYENIAKLLFYFNSRALLELAKNRIADYLREKNMLGYLAKQPRSPEEKIGSNFYKVNNIKRGISPTEKVIKYYLSTIHEYLLDNANKIYFIDILDQLIDYEYARKKEFDLIAAIGMCEILDTELDYLRVVPKKEEREEVIYPKLIIDPQTGIRMAIHNTKSKKQLEEEYDNKITNNPNFREGWLGFYEKDQ